MKIGEKIDRSNKPWNKEISDEDIFNREITIAYLIQSNQHLEVFQNLKEVVLSTYRVVAEFKHEGFNGHQIVCNNQQLVFRKNKHSDFSTGVNVKILEHNLSRKGGGSCNYPSVGGHGSKVTLEFISYGLPFIDSVNGWSIKVISLDKL
jgi:hypothetical protein